MSFGLVTLSVALDLVFPERRVGLWQDKVFASLVTVPKTTVHEDYSAVLAEHKVGMSGKSGIKQPVTETVGKQEFPHDHFRPGIPAESVN